MRIQKQTSGPRLYTTARGLAVPSVTDVVATADRWDMQRWIAKVGKAEADRIGDEAKTLGTKVHVVAQQVAAEHGQMRTKDADVAPELTPYLYAIREFYDQWVSEVVGTEMQLTSDRWGFGGTLDAYVRLTTGEYAVIDFKTTASLTRNHGLQLYAYGLLLAGNGYPVKRRVAVRLRKDKPGVWATREFHNHQEDKDGFLGALALWRWQQARRLERDMKDRESTK